MLPVVAEVRLVATVRSEGVEVNDLAAWAFREKNAVAQQLVADLVWQMQEQHLQAVLRGEQEIVCPGCGVVGSGPGATLRRGSRPRKVRTSNGLLRFRLPPGDVPGLPKDVEPVSRAAGAGARAADRGGVHETAGGLSERAELREDVPPEPRVAG